MTLRQASAAITAENSFTSPIPLHRHFNLSIGGTFSATITVQRSYDNGANWEDVEEFSAPVQKVGFEPETNVLYRVGCKTGDYTSGTASCRLSQ